MFPIVASLYEYIEFIRNKMRRILWKLLLFVEKIIVKITTYVKINSFDWPNI